MYFGSFAVFVLKKSMDAALVASSEIYNASRFLTRIPCIAPCTDRVAARAACPLDKLYTRVNADLV